MQTDECRQMKSATIFFEMKLYRVGVIDNFVKVVNKFQNTLLSFRVVIRQIVPYLLNLRSFFAK